MIWLLLLTLAAPSLIESLRADFKDAYRDVDPQQAVDAWRVPFETDDRTSIATIRAVSGFGAGRASYIQGHIHTGVDLVPKKPRPGPIHVLPIAHGVVVSIHLSAPHTTVVIKHKLPDGTVLFTSYKHLAAFYVSTGDAVTPQTRLGRLFTRAEAKNLKGPYDHLHFEVRKKFDDYGVASWATMSKGELKERFLAPYSFLKEKLSAR
jgi:murein DD-endopeptidase MepM/ murein hydrolase activator NlpD